MNWCTIMSHTEIFLTVVTGSSPYTLSALQFGLQHPSQAMSSSGLKPETSPILPRGAQHGEVFR